MPLTRRRAGLPPSERRKRFGLLLLAIAAAFAVQGIATPGRWEQLIVAVLLAITLLLALWVAEAKPRVFRPVSAIAALLVLASLIGALVGAEGGVVTRVANLLLLALTPPAIVVGIQRSLRARNRVTIEAVFGVLCLYLLVGMFFAFLYATIGRINGGFFDQNAPATAANCLYFSFTTLTTTGYGDLTAASNLGHTLSVSEALVGQIYLVTVVSVIVGNLGFRRSGPSESAGET
jgi:Ion channel